MSTTKAPALPKNITALVKREDELQSSVDKWSVAAFRAERDRLETIVHSGAASDEDIQAHAASRDGGEVDLNYRSMEASSSAALDAFRRANWSEFREFLRARLQARRDREASIQNDIEVLRSGYGLWVDYSDPEASTTSQLSLIVEGDSPGFIRFLSATEIF